MAALHLDPLKAQQMKDMVGVRHIQAVLLGGALFVNHVQQGNIGIIAVAMTNPDVNNKNFETYDWEYDNVKMSKGSYFYSLMASCLISGYLTTKVDVKLMLLCSTLLGTLVTYLTPFIIEYYRWNAFFFLRMIQGSFKGVIRPLVYLQLVRWLPPDELMLIGPIVLSCIYLGNGMILMMGGYLSTGQGGWPSIFYFSGNIGIIWCLAYIGLGSQSPNTCFYISIYERKYIEDSLPDSIRTPYRKHIPWKKIFTCVPVYALIFTQAANNYGAQSIVKIIPMLYLHWLQLTVRTVGLIVGLPFFSVIFLVYFKYHLIKYITRRRKLRLSEIRHIASGVGQFGAFYFFMYCAFSENCYVAFTFHCLGMISSSFQLNGFYMNYFDLSPNFVGLIVGMVQGVAHLFSILGPYVSFTLYKYYYQDPSGPKSIVQAKEAVYFFIAMFYLVSGIVWEIFGSTGIQVFNDITENDEGEEKTYNESEVIKI